MNPLLRRLHPYPFERLASLMASVTPPSGRAHIPLSIGEPKHAPPAFVGEALCAATDALGTYPVALGTEALRRAIACTPTASVMVRTAGRPSGMAATERPTTAMNRSAKARFPTK